MAAKVWLVTSGSYSNYGVLVGFTSKELADAFVAQPPEGNKETYGDEYTVESYPLLDALPGPNRITYMAQVILVAGAVEQDWRGTLETADWEDVDESEQEKIEVTTLPARPGIMWSDGRGSLPVPPKIRIQARSPDRDRLEQIVREAVAEQLAAAQQV